MHEMGIALEIYRACRDAVAGHGPGRIERVAVAVGELSAVEPDLLRYAWEAVVADTPDAGARLDVEWRTANQHCPACDAPKQRTEGSWLRLCPDCGGILTVSGGDELDVLQLTFSAEDEGDDEEVTA